MSKVVPNQNSEAAHICLLRCNQSCPLVRKIPFATSWTTGLPKRMQKEQRRLDSQFTVQYSLCTELCAAKKQWEQRAQDSVRRPEFNLVFTSL